MAIPVRETTSYILGEAIPADVSMERSMNGLLNLCVKEFFATSSRFWL